MGWTRGSWSGWHEEGGYGQIRDDSLGSAEHAPDRSLARRWCSCDGLSRALERLWVDLAFQRFQTSVTVLSAALFVYESYLPIAKPLPHSVIGVEFGVTLIFMLDMALGCHHRRRLLARHIFSQRMALDALAIAPGLLAVCRPNMHETPYLAVLKTARILRLLQQTSSLAPSDGDATSRPQYSRMLRGRVVWFLISLFILLFISASVVMTMERGYEHGHMSWLAARERPDEGGAFGGGAWDFHGALYFIVVTYSTVGFGDVSAQCAEAQMLMIVLILTAFLIVPYQVNKLAEAIGEYQRASEFSEIDEPPAGASLVLVCGSSSLRPLRLRTLLDELFHPDHLPDNANLLAVVLTPLEPNAEWRALLERYGGRAQLLVGSALSEADLRRARAEYAEAVFVLVDTNAHEASALDEDSSALLRALTIRHVAPETHLFVQLLRPDNEASLAASLPAALSSVVCAEQLTMSLLAYNAVCPGASTLLSNLTWSLSPGARPVVLRRDEATTRKPWWANAADAAQRAERAEAAQPLGGGAGALGLARKRHGTVPALDEMRRAALAVRERRAHGGGDAPLRRPGADALAGVRRRMSGGVLQLPARAAVAAPVALADAPAAAAAPPPRRGGRLGGGRGVPASLSLDDISAIAREIAAQQQQATSQQPRAAAAPAPHALASAAAVDAVDATSTQQPQQPPLPLHAQRQVRIALAAQAERGGAQACADGGARESGVSTRGARLAELFGLGTAGEEAMTTRRQSLGASGLSGVRLDVIGSSPPRPNALSLGDVSRLARVLKTAASPVSRPLRSSPSRGDAGAVSGGARRSDEAEAEPEPDALFGRRRGVGADGIPTEVVQRMALSGQLWQFEYAHGASHELYAVTLSPHFPPVSFREAVLLVFARFGYVLVAVDRPAAQLPTGAAEGGDGGEGGGKGERGQAEAEAEEGRGPAAALAAHEVRGRGPHHLSFSPLAEGIGDDDDDDDGDHGRGRGRGGGALGVPRLRLEAVPDDDEPPRPRGQAGTVPHTPPPADGLDAPPRFDVPASASADAASRATATASATASASASASARRRAERDSDWIRPTNEWLARSPPPADAAAAAVDDAAAAGAPSAAAPAPTPAVPAVASVPVGALGCAPAGSVGELRMAAIMPPLGRPASARRLAADSAPHGAPPPPPSRPSVSRTSSARSLAGGGAMSPRRQRRQTYFSCVALPPTHVCGGMVLHVVAQTESRAIEILQWLPTPEELASARAKLEARDAQRAAEAAAARAAEATALARARAEAQREAAAAAAAHAAAAAAHAAALAAAALLACAPATEVFELARESSAASAPASRSAGASDGRAATPPSGGAAEPAAAAAAAAAAEAPPRLTESFLRLRDAQHVAAAAAAGARVGRGGALPLVERLVHTPQPPSAAEAAASLAAGGDGRARLALGAELRLHGGGGGLAQPPHHLQQLLALSAPSVAQTTRSARSAGGAHTPAALAAFLESAAAAERAVRDALHAARLLALCEATDADAAARAEPAAAALASALAIVEPPVWEAVASHLAALRADAHTAAAQRGLAVSLDARQPAPSPSRGLGSACGAGCVGGHIVVCGSLSALPALMRAFAALPGQWRLVMLHHDRAQYDGVLARLPLALRQRPPRFVEGRPSAYADLVRAGAETAVATVFLAGRRRAPFALAEGAGGVGGAAAARGGAAGALAGQSDERLFDASAVTAGRALHMLRTHWVVELTNEFSTKLLKTAASTVVSARSAAAAEAAGYAPLPAQSARRSLFEVGAQPQPQPHPPPAAAAAAAGRPRGAPADAGVGAGLRPTRSMADAGELELTSASAALPPQLAHAHSLANLARGGAPPAAAAADEAARAEAAAEAGGGSGRFLRRGRSRASSTASAAAVRFAAATAERDSGGADADGSGESSAEPAPPVGTPFAGGGSSAHWWPLFAAGHVFYSSVLDSLLAQAFFNPGMLRLLNQMLGKEATDGGGPPAAARGHIAQLRVPAECVDRPYSELFVRLVAEGKVCMGLYREAGHHGCPLPFVYTNPTAESIVNAGDRVYVLDAAASLDAYAPPAAAVPFVLGGDGAGAPHAYGSMLHPADWHDHHDHDVSRRSDDGSTLSLW